MRGRSPFVIVWRPSPTTMLQFDPDAPAAPSSGIFGLPHTPEEAQVHVLAVPFDATTSYRPGAARAPEAILAASGQVDLFDLWTGRPFEFGIALLETDARIAGWNEEARALAQPIIAAGGLESVSEEPLRSECLAAARRVDELGDQINALVFAQVRASLEQGRLPCVLGGDHSVPYGAIAACAERHPGLGILHVDAHADLRSAYEGFTWSHASIMHNVLARLPSVARIVQIGIRDLGQAEADAIEESGGRVSTIFDKDWARARFERGATLALVREAIGRLPQEVYVSFDVDGLDPALCPNTGTPVPGGLDWHEAMLVLEELARSGRRVVGLDLCECSMGPEGDPAGESWDAIVGARLLYRMIGFALLDASQAGD